jgi:hypothetical protein
MLSLVSVLMLSFKYLYGVSLCWVSLCWVSLCWMSWPIQNNYKCLHISAESSSIKSSPGPNVQKLFSQPLTIGLNKLQWSSLQNICLSISLSFCMFVLLYICSLSVSLSVHLSSYESTCLSIQLFICSSFYLFVSLSLCLSFCFYACLSVCLSVCLSLCQSVSLVSPDIFKKGQCQPEWRPLECYTPSVDLEFWVINENSCKEQTL